MRSRSFDVGLDGIPAHFDQLFADPAEVRQVQQLSGDTAADRARICILLEWQHSRLGRIDEATLAAAIRAMGVLSAERGAPHPDLKEAVGLPRTLEMVPEFYEAAAREAVAMSLTILADFDTYTRPVWEMLTRVSNKQWTLSAVSAASMVLHRNNPDLDGVTRITLGKWRDDGDEFGELVEQLADELLKSCQTGINPMSPIEVLTATKLVDRKDLLVFAGGGAIPSCVAVLLRQ